ncbi:cysteine desulfurase family protein [Commensalibacter oyaizuii]|uniref:Cysteine desulfurase n=1 Tax=Commensalibacter oyaizuii TaxID=3043873 RepID=A0ABT6Q3H8_9PROT|nr:cysteine desulfurase family protein [Commensalibacter sp. TBRC 16381]MDI2091570.1 cysteine desulfurase family protein [Commensalibacter sp. TBRC 16381]
MKKLIYLDYQATTPCDKRVVEAMLPYFSEYFGNAHSDHVMGKVANDGVEIARQQVADLIGAMRSEIIFTSGATEANNLAIIGAVRYLLKQGHTARRVITVCTEHKCVLETIASLTVMGIEPVILPVDHQGQIDPQRLKAALQIPTLLVSVMAANNETGVIHPIAKLAALAHEYGALFHCDMAQIVGKTETLFRVNDMGVDLASMSGHKIYGPKGVGALYVRRRPRVRLMPIIHGGGQERGNRSGTLPVPLIVGLGKACVLMQEEAKVEVERFARYKRQMVEALQQVVPGLKINGSLFDSLPASLNLCFPSVKALDLLARIPHLCVSTGSACTKSSVSPSYVLLEMGLSEDEAFRSFRLSFGRMTTQKEVQQAIHALSCAWHNAMTTR